MSVLFGAGGAKEVKEIYIGAGGQVRKVKEAYVGVGGESKKVFPVMPTYVYGYDLALSNSDPFARVTYPSDVNNAGFTPAAMTRNGADSVFSYGGWPSTPGAAFMPRPCMLLYSGQVDYYLDPNDYWFTEFGGGSDVGNMFYGGNAMMEWPKIYTKRWEADGVYHFRCSDVKVDADYECWCNYDKNNREIPHFYTAIYFGSKDSSGRLRSISTQRNWVRTGGAQAEINAAKLNGADAWYTEVIADRFLIQDLLVMLFKSTDLQKAVGDGLSNYDTSLDTGEMDADGLFWGADSIAHPNQELGVKVFGMEHWWGNLYRRIAGLVNVNGAPKVKLTRGTRDGSTAADYNIDGIGYVELPGVSSFTAEGYISTMKTFSFGRFPIEFNGASDTFESDYARWSQNGGLYPLAGGYNMGRESNGPFYITTDYSEASSENNIGVALSCKPLAG